MIKTIAQGVKLHCIHSEKFKDICISINFFNKNEEISVAQRALLSMILVDRSMQYDTKKKMNQICDHLYGCTLGARVLTYGKAHCIEIRSKIINPRYIHENHNILNDWVNFLSEIIFHPLMQNNLIRSDIFEENKRILISRVKRKEDDAQNYTITKALEMAGKNQPLSIRIRGNEEQLKKLTPNDITERYHTMLAQDQIEIVICGDIDEERLTKLICAKFNFKDRKNEIETYYVFDSQEEQIKTEEKNQPQSNIAMVYSTSIAVNDPLYPALKVANGILGQLPSSYLFQVVREQYSLCYSIFSSLISYDGACLITTGIEKENVDKAVELIHKQIKRCQDGDISDELLETTKKMLVGALINSLDEMTSIIGYHLTNSILKRDYPIEENIRSVNEVTKEDCVQVFQKIKHAATFIYVSKEESDE